jgi:hypothetical protein
MNTPTVDQVNPQDYPGKDVYTVIGHPIAHSRSPIIHMTFAKQANEPIYYGRIFAELDECFGRSEGDEEIQDLLKASHGLNLGLHFLSGAFTYDPVVTKIDPLLASKIVWLDSLITNVDRSFRNTNMLMWHKELWLIDHGSCLYFQYNWEGWEKKAVSPFLYIKDHVLLPQATQMEEADLICRELITDEKIREIVQLIPDEWLQWELQDETPEQLRNVYFTFLSKRLKYSNQFIQTVQDAAETSI